MALSFVRNTLKLSAVAAQRHLSTKALPSATTSILQTTSNDEQIMRVPQLHGTNSYTTSVKPQPITDLNIADILHGVLHKSLFLIDIREPEELSETGKIGKAVNIPVSEIEAAFTMSYADFEAKYRVPKPNVMSERVVIYSRTAKQAKNACETLRRLGYDKVKHYPGGITEWNKVMLGDLEATQEQAAL